MKYVHVQRIVIPGRFQLRIIQIVIFPILQVEIRRTQRHRTVHIDRHDWNFLLIFQLPQVIHESLRAADRERRNHDRTTALHYAVHDIRKHCGRIAGFVFAIAIG